MGIGTAVDQMVMQNFRDRITKLYESPVDAATDAEADGSEAYNAPMGGTVNDAKNVTENLQNNGQKNLQNASETEITDDIIGNAQGLALAPRGTPLSEIASQPAPFISTGAEQPPEMQIGNRILEMSPEVDGTQDLTVVLKPRELGEVQIRLVTVNGEIAVSVTAADPKTAQLLDGRASELMTQLTDKGLNVRTVVIASNSSNTDLVRSGQQGAGGQQGQAGQGGQQAGQQGQQEEQMFRRELGEEPLIGEIDGQFTPDDFQQRRLSLWRSA
jgi:flagellar hook-length control protein FliK